MDAFNFKTFKTQTEILYLARKTSYELEQKIKTMELEQKDQKAEFEKIKAQNQTLFKSMDCHQDLVEKLKSEIEDLKLQKQGVAQDLANESERFKRSFKVSSRQIEDLKQEIEGSKQEIENSNQEFEDLKIKHESQINQWKETATNLEAQLDKANSQIDDLKLKNQSLQDDWFKQASQISNLTESNLDLEKKLRQSKDDIKKAFENRMELKQTIGNLNGKIVTMTNALEAEKYKNQKLEKILETSERNESNIEKENLNLTMNNQTLTEDLKIQSQIFKDLKTSLNEENKTNLLHLACQEGLKEQVKMFLEIGAQINTKSNSGATPLHLATKNDHLEIVQILLQNGADTNAEQEDCLRFTPLHTAALNGHVEVSILLLQNGARIDAKTNCYKLTPLHYAVIGGFAELAEIFLQNGADVNATDKDLRTPLHRAVENAHIEIIKILLKYGARKDLKDCNMRTALQLAEYLMYFNVSALLK